MNDDKKRNGRVNTRTDEILDLIELGLEAKSKKRVVRRDAIVRVFWWSISITSASNTCRIASVIVLFPVPPFEDLINILIILGV